MKNKINQKYLVSLILGIMCCFLTAGIMLQIKTVSNSTTTVGKTQIENELRDSLLRWNEKQENASKNLAKKEKELEMLRDNVATSSGSSSDLADKLSKYDALLGYTDVVGKGIVITLKDGDPSKIKGVATEYIVHDIDIVQVVNALKNVGAEAISVNGQRITSRSSVSCVGNVIMVDGQKLGSPFVIKAIGSPQYLYSSLKMPGGYLSLLENWGVQVKVEQVESDTIEIPKYTGMYTKDYIAKSE